MAGWENKTNRNKILLIRQLRPEWKLGNNGSQPLRLLSTRQNFTLFTEQSVKYVTLTKATRAIASQ